MVTCLLGVRGGYLSVRCEGWLPRFGLVDWGLTPQQQSGS